MVTGTQFQNAHVEKYLTRNLKVITGARECSPVLTAIHHSNGRFCDFLLFFSKTPGGQTPQLIVTQNGLNDADSGKDVPFGVKIESFCTIWPPAPENRQNLAHFGLDLENFRSISL